MNAPMIGVALVVASAVVEGFAQVFLKKSVAAGSNKTFWVGLGLAAFAVEGVLWTGALHALDLSVAYPLGSLSFIAVTILSQWLLREAVPRQRWLGAGLILAGTALIGGRV
jgi:drug/metabolite transporter (DMT)-like permease